MRSRSGAFAKYAWFVLAFNILVILWGVFLRASKSGDGCGRHWLTCGGEVVPSAPELKTVIEFTHRITSAFDGLLVILLLAWAIYRWRSLRDEGFENFELKAAVGAFVFVVIEGLLGAGLVLTGNTAETLTPERPFWMAAHLVNTLILLTFLTLTAWFASGGARLALKADSRARIVIAVAVAAFLCIGITGSIAALSSMIFPSQTLAEGLDKDFSATSNFLLRLRLLHPIISILSAIFLIFAAGWLRRRSNDDRGVVRWSNILSILVLVQIAFGAATLLTLAPIVMQLGHLLLADAIWISIVMLAASYFSRGEPNLA
ncbi:MAG: COX15/CtaA family protein [Acidobacteriota bacterium]